VCERFCAHGSILPEGWSSRSPRRVRASGSDDATARDQVTLLHHLGQDQPGLRRSATDYGESLMHDVVPTQDWGVSAGLPGGV